MLDTELGRRIVAAAALNGWERKELPEHFGAYGKGVKHTASRLARDPEAKPDKLQLRLLSDVLGVPIEWFTAPDWRDLIPGARPPGDEARTVREVDEDEEPNLPAAPSAPTTAEPNRGAANS